MAARPTQGLGLGRVEGWLGVGGIASSVLTPDLAQEAMLRAARTPAGEENMRLAHVMLRSLSGLACLTTFSTLNTTRCERMTR